MPEDEQLAMRRLELEFSDKREARKSELFKWFVLTIVHPLSTALITWLTIGLKVDAVKQTIDANSPKIEAAAQASATTALINTEWKAQRTGDPDDMAKVDEAVERLAKVANGKSK